MNTGLSVRVGPIPASVSAQWPLQRSWQLCPGQANREGYGMEVKYEVGYFRSLVPASIMGHDGDQTRARPQVRL